MQIFRTIVSYANSVGKDVIDSIFYEDKLWLVGEWSAAPSEGWQQPARIVCIHDLPYQNLSDSEMPADYLLTVPMPKSVLDGETDTVKGHKYEIVEFPDIRFQVGRA